MERIEKLKLEKSKISEIKADLEISVKNVREQYQRKKANIDRLLQSQDNEASMLSLNQELANLENILRQHTSDFVSNEQLVYLIEQRAIADFQLKQLNTSDSVEEESVLVHHVELLKFAISILRQERRQLGKEILNDLSNLMLEEVHLLGLSSITEISISEDFVIKYKQDGDFVSFDDIAEGEQLRVKISLYLSLIQLDIKYNSGKHTRFLILDSPSKEEGDALYIEGLSKLLQSIESRFNDELQIFIGTAERKLSNIVVNETLLGDGEFLF